MHSYIITGIRMGPFVRLLRKHGINWSFRNIIRVIYIGQNSLWASLFAWRDRITWDKKIEKYPVTDDPLIIIGHWRTGSTLLHYLMALDKQIVTPFVYQVTFPDSFLTGHTFYGPVMKLVLRHRPMDHMEMFYNSPQEEEFALVKLTYESPLFTYIFPENEGYVFKDLNAFQPSPENREQWKEQLRTFSKRIRKDSGRVLLLKNPFHSLRLSLLLETFPKARFIYIHRHPYQVIPSTINLWKVLMKDNQLGGRPYTPTVEEVTEGLGLFYREIEPFLSGLPRDRYCILGCDSLEKDPVSEVKKIYQTFGLEFTEAFQQDIQTYLDRVRDFRKNSYTFGEKDKKLVFQKLKKYFEQYGYKA